MSTRLRSLFLAGERCDVETLEWAKRSFRVPVLDHWWQTGKTSVILKVSGNATRFKYYNSTLSELGIQTMGKVQSPFVKTHRIFPRDTDHLGRDKDVTESHYKSPFFLALAFSMVMV